MKIFYGRTDGQWPHSMLYSQFHFSDQFLLFLLSIFYFHIIHSLTSWSCCRCFSGDLAWFVPFNCVSVFFVLFCVPSCFVWPSFPAVDCGQPQPFRNGRIAGGGTVYPNVMHFNCDEGFILRGASKIKCQTNGTWSKTSSFCDGKQ